MNRNLIYAACGASFLALSGTSGQALAQDMFTDMDIFAGASVGSARTEADVDGTLGTLNLDDSDVGYKAFAGATFGIFGIEGGYVNFGEAEEGTPLGRATLEVDGWDLFAVLNFPAGPVDMFVKAGYLWWDADLSGGGVTGSTDGEDPAYGIGASFAMTDALNLRVEYEYFDVDDVDRLDMLSAGVEFRF